ncbi:MAG TPA: DNA methyltransferase [Prolixibacteraceae bacterium]
MGKLHDALKESGYTGHELEKYLVRLLFCLFADDTTIFGTNAFHDYILNKTNEDGTDLGMHIAQLFQVLNTPDNKRQKTLDESLAAFPFINGQLFYEQLSFASFNSRMRQTLLECCYLDWSKISPAIFGSMFQSVMDANQRRNLGAHYTSEKNIQKLIKPLFLDKLWQEFESVKNNTNKLKTFHRKIASLRFLDPACGCGNFLVITYRELRMLELAILKEQQKGQQVINLESLVLCNVDRFYGIEYEEFPAQIAQVALWLIDHQMNMHISQEFGDYFARLPLTKSAHIVHGNSLRTDWDSLLNPERTVVIYANELNYIEKKEVAGEPDAHYKTLNVVTKEAKKVQQFSNEHLETPDIQFDYILGNPPFIGKQLQNEGQKSDMEQIFWGVKSAGVLDYVTAWYIKAAQYLQKHNTESNGNDIKTRVAFVSTNSIAQGEQVGVLWNEMFNRYKIKIHFAHRTFKWGNEAKANAAVHVVIIGFSNFDIPEKLIYEYDDIKGEPHELKVKNINPYLIEGKDLNILKRRQPICNVPEISFGSMPNDGGFLLLSDNEKIDLLKIEPEAEQYIKPLLSAYEYLNGEKRWCLWLVNANPSVLRKLSEISKRIDNVRKNREASTREATNKLSAYPTLFGENRQPDSDYILIPRHSSENRKYIPFGLFDKSYIVSDSCLFVPKASLFHFGVLSSLMHIVWVKTVCGRIKSDFRYSNEMVYNNYPWPEISTEKQKETIEKAAQKVLDVRAEFPNSSLADLYDPLTMPPALVKAHNELDKAVDLAYRQQPFINETKRIEFLFELYDKYTAGLFATEKKKKRK